MRGGWSGREAGAGTNYRSSVFLSASRITHTIVGRLSHLRGREREREKEGSIVRGNNRWNGDGPRKDRGGRRQLVGRLCRHSVSHPQLEVL